MQPKLINTHPILQERVLQILAQCKAAKLKVKIFEGLRTQERQQLLFDSGKSKTLHSYHLIGLACDIVFLDSKGSWTWTAKPTQWDQLSRIMVVCKLDSGHTWKTFVDSPHCQLSVPGFTGQMLHMKFRELGRAKFYDWVTAKVLK